MTVYGGEYAFVMPGRIEGGVVTMTFANVGREVHEFVLARLHDGKSLVDVRRYLAQAQGTTRSDPPWLEDVGGVSLLNPGRKVRLTRELEPGRYVFICTFPSQEGVPHYRLGMLRAFTVAGDSGRKVPEADATVTAHDATMEVPPLRAGHHVLRLVNAAREARGFDLITFKERNRFELLPWAERGYKGLPPATFLGVMHPVPSGTEAYVEVTFGRGEIYVFYDDDSGIRHEFVPE